MSLSDHDLCRVSMTPDAHIGMHVLSSAPRRLSGWLLAQVDLHRFRYGETR